MKKPVNLVTNTRAMRPTPYEQGRNIVFYQLRYVAKAIDEIEVCLEIDDVRESEPDTLYQE